MNSPTSRNEWLFSKCRRKLDKEKLIDSHIMYMLLRTQEMFKYENLPETIPKRDLELLLQVNGFAIIKELKGNLYAFYGGLGGVPNEYYLPTVATVANPYLEYNAILEIDKDCVVINNDSLRLGLMELNSKYATLLAETDISIRVATVNSRITKVLQANTDSALEDCKMYLQKIENGELGVMAGNAFIESLNSIDYNNNSNAKITELIELQQYLRATWFNELCLNSNYNMKRENLNVNETEMNDNILFPLIDHMLEQRKIGVEKVNKMYGTNISVDLDSSWKRNVKEMELNEDLLEKELETNEEVKNSEEFIVNSNENNDISNKEEKGVEENEID